MGILVLRVIVHDGDIRKITWPEKPDNVATLITQLEEHLGLQYKFTIQYEDPDFNNALCNLNDIKDLPDKATLKIMPLLTSPSCSLADTELLSDCDRSSPLDRQKVWPEKFEIPKFSVNVEYRLRQGNLIYTRDNKSLEASRDLKHDILEGLAGEMYKYTAYPTEEHYTEVACELIKAHPCLKEPGNTSGFASWKSSIAFKMANFRTKLRKSGCREVELNRKRRGNDASGSTPLNRGIKRPRRGELNFLPNFPDGQDENSLESRRKNLVEEMKKKRPDMTMVGQNMDLTFALRRKELVDSDPPVSETNGRWPALFTESQIFAEFGRISGKNLRQQFYAALDGHTDRFLQIFRSKGGAVGKTLKAFVGQIDTKTSDVTERRTAVLRGLPVLLGDDSDEVFRTCFNSDVDADFHDVPVAVLTVIPEDEPAQTPHSLHFGSARAIILEDGIVVDDLPNLPQAVCLLFGLMYALNLDYPKQMKNTFEFIEMVFLSMSKKSLKPKLQTLKNQLLA